MGERCWITPSGDLVLYLSPREAGTVVSRHKAVVDSYKSDGIVPPDVWLELFAACRSVGSVSGSGTVPQRLDLSTWLSTKQVAQELGISDSAVRRKCRNRELIAQRRGKKWLVEPTQLTEA